MDKPNRPMTVAQNVAAQIREQILDRTIKGGEPLRQEAIAKTFGTSIIPVREALRQLEAEGLVEVKTHRGAVATELTLSKALEWIHMRRLIETDLIGIAIDKMRDEHIQKAEAILDRFNAALSDRVQMEHWSHFNWEFHSALYAAAYRPETLKVLSLLHKYCDRYIRLQLVRGDHITRAQDEHRELLELCKKHNKRAAKGLMLKHIVGVEEDLVEELGS